MRRRLMPELRARLRVIIINKIRRRHRPISKRNAIVERRSTEPRRDQRIVITPINFPRRPFHCRLQARHNQFNMIVMRHRDQLIQNTHGWPIPRIGAVEQPRHDPIELSRIKPNQRRPINLPDHLQMRHIRQNKTIHRHLHRHRRQGSIRRVQQFACRLIISRWRGRRNMQIKPDLHRPAASRSAA